VVVRGRSLVSGDSCTKQPPERVYGVGSPPTNHDIPHAVEISREGVPLLVIQRQLGHADLAITSVYLGGSTTRRSFMPSMSARRR
jgi:integrase